MRAGIGSARLAGAALAALLLASGSWAQPPGSIPPVFTQRLQIPVRGDDLQQPRAVVADLHSGEILVCDTLANRILIFDPQGRFRYEIPGGSAFLSPVDLAVDPEGYLYVLSQVSAEVTLLDFDGRLLRKAPLSGLPESALTPRLVSLAISPDGDRLYLMDAENDRLWITDRQGAVQRSVDTTVGRSAKEIDELRYGHVDVYGETVLLPIPNDGLVHLFDLEGRARGTIGDPGSAECQVKFPTAAALDDRGRVIILDQQRALFMTWDLERGVCLSEHYGFGNAPGAFYQPNDLALDGAGRLYVSQGFEGRVQVYEGARPAAAVAAPTRVAEAGVGRPEAVPEPPAAEPAVEEEAAAAERPGEPAVAAPAAAAARPATASPSSPPAVEPEPPPTPVRQPIVSEPESEPVREPVVPAPEPVREPIVPAPEPRRTAVAAEPAPPPAEPGIAAVQPSPPALAALLVAGARQSVDRAPRYDPSYVELAYPGGDPPSDRGGAVDLVVRAFRHAGIDLQQALQEDRRAAPGAYPINEPDPSIDHRRIRNLVLLFERRAASLPTAAGGDWAAGDVVFWDRNSDGVAGHLGIVTDERGPSGQPLVAHHHRPTDEFPGTPGVDDVLFRWPIVGHYRWPSAGAAAGPAPSAQPATVEQTVRAWARAWAGKRVEEYLSFYSAQFDPEGGLSRSEWRRQRSLHLQRPAWIEVSLAQIESRPEAEGRMRVSFSQTYRSDLYADRVDKLLVLRGEEGGWKILAERVVGSVAE